MILICFVLFCCIRFVFCQMIFSFELSFIIFIFSSFLFFSLFSLFYFLLCYIVSSCFFIGRFISSRIHPFPSEHGSKDAQSLLSTIMSTQMGTSGNLPFCFCFCFCFCFVLFWFCFILFYFLIVLFNVMNIRLLHYCIILSYLILSYLLF